MSDRTSRSRKAVYDVAGIFWGLLSQWKAILLCCLVLALIVCSARYRSDRIEYKRQVEKQSEAEEQTAIPAAERAEALLASISEDESAAVRYILHEQEWLEQQKEYLNESVLMQADPTNMRVLSVLFDMYSEQSEETEVLTKDYRIFVMGEDMAEALKPFIAPKAKTNYVQELISPKFEIEEKDEESSYEDGQAVLTIEIISGPGVDEDAVAETVIKMIKDHSIQLQEKYPHTITVSSTSAYNRYDSEIASRKTSTINSINSMEKSLVDARGQLSDTQKSIMEKITAIQSGDGQAETETRIPKPQYSKKYALLGFMLGAVLYAAVYILVLILRARVNTAFEAENYSGSRLLGEVYYPVRHKGVQLLLHSRTIDKLHYGSRLNSEEQLRKIGSSIEAVCDHKEAKALTLVDMSGAAGEKTVAYIKTYLGNKDLKVNIADDCVLDDEKAVGGIENAVIVVSSDTMADRMIGLMELCDIYKIDKTGCIYTAGI